MIRTGTEGGVQIHQVNPFGAVALPLQGSVEWVTVGCFAAELALDEPHRLPACYVHRGKKFKCHDQQRTGCSVEGNRQARSSYLDSQDFVIARLGVTATIGIARGHPQGTVGRYR